MVYNRFEQTIRILLLDKYADHMCLLAGPV
jgi:hypothetical protein